MILDQEQLQQIETHITEILPLLLRKNPDIAVTIADILVEYFPTRDEFARLLEALTQFRAETSARFDRVDADIKELKIDVAQLKIDVAQLKIDVSQLKTDMVAVRTELGELKEDVADLKGSDLEWQFRERPFVYFSRFARRLRPVSDAQLAELIEDALDRGALSETEADDLKRLDSIAVGRRHDHLQQEESATIYLAIETSWVIKEYDLQRAVRRAQLLAKATGCRVRPVVAGQRILDSVRTEAERVGVGWVIRPQER